MDTPWRIELLGHLCAQQGDLVVMRFRTQKTALLLARLALFPQRDHPREELADLLWPDASLEAARNNLKQSLATLRRLIEPPGMPTGSILIATRTAIRLNPAACITDVFEFKQAIAAGLRTYGTSGGVNLLRQAIALYQGELLPGFYDDWILEERDLLECLLREAQAALADVTAGSGVGTLRREIEPAAEPQTATLLPALRLPLQFTRFFGRDQEQAEIVRCLQDIQVRLLTLTGSGGAGKTRLSLEVARHLAASYGNRVYFAPLADFTDPAFIFGGVADALHLPRASQNGLLDQIVAALSGAPALLVLDNLEQFGASAGPAVLTLLTRLPVLTILATSRQRLYVAGEQEFPVAPLLVPFAGNGDRLPSLDVLCQSPGVQVFVDRAQMARPDFQLTARNAEAVVEVCRLVEGLPLALELAAAWAQVLTPAQMRDRLQERFSFLVSRTKNVLDRHQTLWVAIEWSCRLLPPAAAVSSRVLAGSLHISRWFHGGGRCRSLCRAAGPRLFGTTAGTVPGYSRCAGRYCPVPAAGNASRVRRSADD
ncbi:MAG: AfsR/SARP family transcriptional regulator [Janthinobacterium lividum]